MKKVNTAWFYIRQYFKAPENSGIFMPYFSVLLVGIYFGESLYKHSVGEIIFSGSALALIGLILGLSFKTFVVKYKETGKREAFLRARAIAQSNDAEVLYLLKEQENIAQQVSLLSSSNQEIEKKLKKRMDEIDSEVRVQIKPLLDSKPAMYL